jgi:hypothetical protein
MRLLLIALAAGGLGACETMPAYLQSTSATADNGAAVYQPAASQVTPVAFTAPPDQQLLELERQLSAVAQERGLGGALASVIDPTEGIVIRPGVTLSGGEAIERGLAAPASAGPMYWQPDRVHVSNGGDMGMTSGRYVQVMTGSEAVQGRYVVVWRRDAGGDWKALTETRIPDPPRAVAARRR